MTISARFEFKIEDSWIGVFWKRSIDESVEVNDSETEAVIVSTPRLDVWVCFVPWFPLHVVWVGKETSSEAMRYITDRHIEDIVKGSGWEFIGDGDPDVIFQSLVSKSGGLS